MSDSDDDIDVEEEEQEDQENLKSPLKESLKGQKDVETLFEFDDDDFYKKWSGPIILGPFIHAILALTVIVSGQLVLNSWDGTCNYPLDGFVSAAIAVCYIFLLVFTWVFIGETIHIQIPSFGSFKLFTPFRSLKWLMFYYVVIMITSFIVFIVGAVLLQLSEFCAQSAPTLYNYAQAIFIMYWLTFVFTVIYLVKLFFGSNIGKLIRETTKATTVQDMELQIFKNKFDEFDVDGTRKIPRDSVPSLLGALGVFVPPEEQDQLLETLDPNGSGFIRFEPMRDWFKELNEQLDENLGMEDDSFEDDGGRSKRN